MRQSLLKIKSVSPSIGVEGGKLRIEGTGFDPEEVSNTRITFGGVAARPLLVSSKLILTEIPDDAASGPLIVHVNGRDSKPFAFNLAARLSGDVNPVDSPVFDPEGNLYVAYSGKRGESPEVSVFRITPDGEIRPHLSNVPNATSMAFDPQGNLYISSRFEGSIYRATPSQDVSVFVRDLGTPTGLAFDRDGFLYAGDRGGKIFKISSTGEAKVFAEIPESMVAYHLAFDNDGNLLVTNPGLSSYNQLLMIDPSGKSISLHGGFGRPQGLAVDSAGAIYVCEAKAGDSCVYRISKDGEMKMVVTGPVMVGIALDGKGNAAVTSQNAVYKISNFEF